MLQSNGAAQAVAISVDNDSELKRLRRELAELNLEMKAAERKIPENLRDIESIESHVLGESTGDVRAFLNSVFQTYLPLKEYSKMLLRRTRLEDKIFARVDHLTGKSSN